MTRENQDRAALRKAGLVAVPFHRQQRPCPGPDEPACIQALCVDCGSFSTAPSLTTPMQPAARFVVGKGWECVEFHGAECAPSEGVGVSLPHGASCNHSAHRIGVSA